MGTLVDLTEILSMKNGKQKQREYGRADGWADGRAEPQRVESKKLEYNGISSGTTGQL